MSSTGGDGDEESAVSGRVEGKLKTAVMCWILGTGAAFSWNTMLNISDYFHQGAPPLQHYPSRVLNLVYEAVALGTMMLYAYHEAKLDTLLRVGYGYFLSWLCTFLFFMGELMAVGTGGGRNYRGLCALVGFFGFLDASIQGGLVGDLFLMDPKFLQSFLAGMATSGALTSALKLFTKAVFDKANGDLRVGTVLLSLFISAAYHIVCAILNGLVMPEIPIVKHYLKKAALEGSKTVLHDIYVARINVGDTQDPNRLSQKTLIYKNLDLVLDLYLISGLTFFLFPGFLFKNTTHNQLGSWYGVLLVALYNISDVAGRCVTLVEFMKLESRKGLMVACLSRLSLIPCFYFTAKYGGRGWMTLLVAFLGLTNGYLIVCALVVAPREYRAPEKNALGNLLFVFLLGGALSGAVLDYLWLVGVL